MSKNNLKNIFNSLLKTSKVLENLGLNKSSAKSLNLIENLIKEAQVLGLGQSRITETQVERFLAAIQTYLKPNATAYNGTVLGFFKGIFSKLLAGEVVEQDVLRQGYTLIYSKQFYKEGYPVNELSEQYRILTKYSPTESDDEE